MHTFVNGQNWPSLVSVSLIILFLGLRVSHAGNDQDHDPKNWGNDGASFSIWLTFSFVNRWGHKAYFHLIMAELMHGLRSKELIPAIQVHTRKLLTPFPAGNGSQSFAPVTGVNGHPGASKKLNLSFVVTICVVAFVASKVVLAVILCRCRSNNKRICDVSVSGGRMVLFQSPDSSPYRTVLRKTEQLTKEDIIGSGGYGMVYKLVLDDGTAFAVKKLVRGDIERDRGFERELETLSDINHRNLVKLCGYFSAPQINLLFYALMTNGSLDEQLHERSSAANPLDWPARFKIALGAARGIAYLHHDCVPHIIHRDIKSSNILLDESMEAHISDFGLAKLMAPRETHVTTIIAGTLGYMAPEYVDTGNATLKGDVYSYGIVLLELVSGKRPSDEVFVEKGITLVSWEKKHLNEQDNAPNFQVKALEENGQVKDAFDECLKDFPNEIELIKTVGLALLCVSRSANMRPTMNQVVHTLEEIRVDVEIFS